MTSDDSGLVAEAVEQRYGAFEDFEAVDMGETDVADDHDVAGVENE